MIDFKSILRIAILTGLILVLNGNANAATVVIKTPPPALKVVVKPKAIYAKAVWIPGRWVWHRGKYIWVGGYWVRHRPGHVYVPGRWVQRSGGWVWVSGRWKKM